MTEPGTLRGRVFNRSAAARRAVAELRRRVKGRRVRDLTPDPRFQVELATGYNPAEPLSKDEWPGKLR